MPKRRRVQSRARRYRHRCAWLLTLLAITLPVTVAAPGIASAVTDTVSITAPTDGATVSGSVDAEVTSSTSSPVSFVDWQLASTVSQESTASPYSATLDSTQVDNGPETLEAAAHLEDGSTVTATITVDVENATFCDTDKATVVVPVANTTVRGTKATLSAHVQSSSGGSPDSTGNVVFSIDGARLPTGDFNSVGNDDYSMSWNSTTVTNGTHTLTAEPAQDGASCTGASSDPVEFTVTNEAPTVRVTKPANRAVLSRTVAVGAGATAASGSHISSVSFQIDGRTIGTDTQSPFSVPVRTTSLSNGRHQLAARATDNFGLVTTSAPITVTIKNDRTRWDSLKVNRHGGPPGTIFTIRGSLHDATNGKPIMNASSALYGRTAGAHRYHLIAHQRTARHGRTLYTVKPKSNERLRITYGGGGPYTASASHVVHVVIHPVLSLTKDRGPTRPNKRIFFTVRSHPHTSRLRLTLQLLRRGAWHKILRFHAEASGVSHLWVRFPHAGREHIRIVHAPDSMYASARSNRVNLTLKRHKKAAAPPPAPTHSCTRTSTGSCIRKGEFCPQADYGQTGYDAAGDPLICTGDTTHPHWE
jgi:hypothetical protein